MDELYIADLRLDLIAPDAEAEIVLLLTKPWRVIYIAGALVARIHNAQQVIALFKERASLHQAVKIAAQHGEVIFLWDSTSPVSRRTLQRMIPDGQIVVNHVVENMVRHANRFDNKPQQRVIWFGKPRFFLHGVLESVDRAVARFFSNRRWYHDGAHSDPVAEGAVGRYKAYQLLATESRVAGGYLTPECTYYRW